MNVSRSIQRPLFPVADHDRQQRRGTEQNPGSNMKIPGKPESKLLDHLNEQKQSLMERRSEYLGSALKRGESQDTIQAELASMDEQIQQLEQQIQKQTLDNRNKTLGLDEDDKKKKEETSQESWSPEKQTPEEQRLAYTTYTMSGVISAGNDLKQSGAVRMAQTTLRTEAKSWENSNSVKSASLLQKVTRLDQNLMSIAKDVQDQIKENVQSAPSPVIQDESPANVQDKNAPATGGGPSRPELEIYAEANKTTVPPGSQIDKVV
ncbi:muscle M-line assembly protein unc-89 Uncoordinated protein 89 [Paenibacillus graminis]|uniref:muscle M-line assembly protein unc-89 Uncoordinated protein 89 n=1 Tax=Paenibacillus graminis TaxID=189425 RepID=UPI002DB5D0CC|nr:muscle M-line assembly protein unc-89 Uncoordinated protein 89 [Paenibacillus graminis]MEC0172697.1 muscle M-line assembly protein unc-89 Uncoordinated protein 89 [Paenibacillus graminis]